MGGEWVPCVSCLHPVFDTEFEIKHDIAIIFHKKTLKKKHIIDKCSAFPAITNNSSFETMVTFIGNTETLITNSYHAMYWGMLLGKKVVVVPNSSKFFNFKYKPAISTFSTFKEDIKKAKSYSGLLEECREINLAFAGKVFNYLNL